MRISLICLAVILITINIFGQAPQSMSYQAVIRDADNNLVANHVVGMRVSILQGSATGAVVYVETQTPSTNANGLISIEIGGGTGFDAIDWANGPYFIKSETDATGGTNYTISGTSQLLSVPYALYSKATKNLSESTPSTGDLLYFNGTKWTSVNRGLPGQYLRLSVSNPSIPEWYGGTLPSVTTKEASDITGTSATTGGIISSNGGAQLSSSGVCWATTPNPTIDDSKISSYSGESFTSYITGLNPATTYHVRAFANNSIGLVYGNEIILTTKTLTAPSLTTTAVTLITATTAASGGNVTDDGWNPVTARGVCWSTLPNPTISAGKTSNGTGTGIFISSLTGLIDQTVYYLRAYATNSAGTSYGNEISFKTGYSLPTVITSAITSISQTTSISGGNVTFDGGITLLARGVCWSTNANPTITDSKTIESPSTGIYTSILTGLAANTVYHYKAYVTNSVGTSYGDELTFKTFKGTLTDVEGNVYNTITIGTQEWMAENLKTTKYNDGTTPIPNLITNVDWYSTTTGAYCNYNNSAGNSTVYGKLYNWYAITDNRKLCPTGWHIPSLDEWSTLIDYLGGTDVATKKLMEGGNSHWTGISGTNESGFTALPGGFREHTAYFLGVGVYGKWWSSTDYNPTLSNYHFFIYSYTNFIFSELNFLVAASGASVRCLKDN
jgi:uncharacterized protein (TIGR02145 family)